MNLPKNIELPFFAYGLFKPGQLCYFRIKDLVENISPVEVNGILKERDGIPLLISCNDSKVKGVLIRFQEGKKEEAYGRVIEIEPDRVYRWEEISASSTDSANALVGRRTERGSSDLENIAEWDGRTDPFFNDAIQEIESVLKDNSEFHHGDHKSLFRLQMAYTLLWSALERYTGLRYHLGKNVTKKVFQISKEKQFAQSLKKYVKETRSVYSSDDLDKFILDPKNPDSSIKYYYQVRSNAVHRGKVVIRDFDILKSSLEELLAIFKDVLEDAFKK